MLISDVKNNLSAMLHGGSLNKVRNIYDLMFRASRSMLSKIDTIETMRTYQIPNTVHDNVYNYSLPSDFKKMIDLMPQDERALSDYSTIRSSQYFDLQKAIKDKIVAIEGNGTGKFLRIDWSSRTPKTLHTMNDYDENGEWTAVGTAENIAQDELVKYTGSGSVRFDAPATGDGIQNTTMDSVDLSNEDEVGAFFAWVYLKDSTELAKLTSVGLVFGNDLTTNYWTGVNQTAQADGTAFKVGWNLVKFEWTNATETGIVDPEEIDSLKIIINSSGAISDIRIDNITCSFGRLFELKYYSKYIFKNSAGTLIEKPTDDTDEMVCDESDLIFIHECVVASAHQIEGADSLFDINFSKLALEDLYNEYEVKFPSEFSRRIESYGSPVRYKR